MINGLTAGATIHEIDSKIDHGPILAQREVTIYAWDDSKTLYDRISEVEIQLLDEYLVGIIENKTSPMPQETGNINYKDDYKNLCEINLEDKDTFQNHINILRALSHGAHQNAFFKDENGDNIYLRLVLFKD